MNRVVILSDEMIAQIRAAPTKTLGWFDPTLCNAWKRPFPITPTQHQDRGSCTGSPGVGTNAQSMVEIHHRHSTTIIGGDRDIKWVEEAISHAPLQRIRVGHLREEDYGLPRIGLDSHGKSSHVEADSDSSPSQEMQPTDQL